MSNELLFILKKTLKVVWSQVFFLKIRFFFQFFSIFVDPQFKFHKFHQAEDY